MMRIGTLLTVAALAAATLHPAFAAPDSLEGTSWLLLELPGMPADSMAASAAMRGTTPTMTFERNRIVGSDGCNQFFTSGTAAGGAFSSQPGGMAATLRACPPPVMKFAGAYRTALTSATAYRLDARRLTLLDADGKSLAEFRAQRTDLAGTAWEVTGYNNGRQAVVSVAIGTTLTAEFRADGKLAGSAGCNRYNASYEVQKGAIRIGPAMSTRRACAEPEGIMEQEHQYLKALATAATYRFDGNRLELRTAEGALAATLVRTDSGD